MKFNTYLYYYPEVAPGQEAGGGVPGQVVDPALLPQLGHDGVNPGEPGLSIGPLGQGLTVAIPGNLQHVKAELNKFTLISDSHLNTNLIADHFVKVWISGRRTIEEFSPQKLTVKR